jgi:16S rRNA (adenine1518-N6/adenine1519-N6)-dimethyltransferase
MRKPVSPKEFFASLGRKPRKSLGQNFLMDPRVAARIVDAAQVTGEDDVLEIGPGFGALTLPLAERARRVIAIERDGAIVPALREAVSGFTNVEIVVDDALRVDLSSLIRGRRLKVVSNLPYSISSQIMMKLLDERELFSLMVLMLQREVAERMTAPPGGRDYGILTVLIGAFCDVRVLFRVPRDAFWPQPDVESAVLRIEPLPEPRTQIPDEALFRRLVKASFSGRRKMIGNSLRVAMGAEEVAVLLERAGIERTRRAETLSIEEFGRLCRAAVEEGGP